MLCECSSDSAGKQSACAEVLSRLRKKGKSCSGDEHRTQQKVDRSRKRTALRLHVLRRSAMC